MTTFRTEAGSILTVTGKHGGIGTVDFDWLEEGGCIDCEPYPYPFEGDLVWHCDICGGGRAKLTEVHDG